MAPSLLQTVGAAAVALAAQASATQSYKVSEIYNSTNFFDKFDFVTGTDPNGGYVQYQSRTSATNLGLIKTSNDEVYIGVDHTEGDYNPSGVGRKSVRLESKNVYNHGLVIADFTYLPKPVCGSWPAFWFFGDPWPTKGEIDIYENWNDLTFNRHTAHVDSPDVVGTCELESAGMTSTIDSPNCYDFAAGQADYQGCSASEYTTTFGSASGGIFAMEWTSDYLKIWDWPRLTAPADVLIGKPAPSLLWGTPAYIIKTCDIDKAFKDMKMVLNIDFCAVAGQADKWDASCKAKTGYATCQEYVAKKNDDFALANFKVKDIKIYQLGEDSQGATSSSTASTSSSMSTTPSSTLFTSSTSTTSTSSAVTSSSSSASVTATSSASYAATSSTTSEDDDTCTDDNDETSSSYVASSTTSLSVTTTGSSSSSLVTGSGYPTLGQTTATSSAVSISSSEASQYTTSTIYTTSVHTITSCAPTVTNCPAGGYVTTETISIGTTVCPVTESGSSPKPTTTASVPEGYTTSTIEVTKTYTITSCKPTVTNCPVGSVTTEISVTTTVCPIGNVSPSSSPVSSSGNPVGNTSAGSYPVESTGAASKPETESATAPSGPSAGYVATTNNAATPSATGSNSSASSSETNVAVTATVYPVTSVNGGYNATLTTSMASPAGSAAATGSAGSGCIGAGCNVVEISGGIKLGASLSLASLAAFFFLAM
ncbi:glycoside hydrolase family 16 protein [Hypoxylon sp. FL0890]|nr:glycoside hydrolase family 16 protein [Hypoxylon sp. FL0890]